MVLVGIGDWNRCVIADVKINQVNLRNHLLKGLMF